MTKAMAQLAIADAEDEPALLWSPVWSW
jgi:hypothetical protein